MTVHTIQRELSRMDGNAPRYKNIDGVLYLTERHAAQTGRDITFPVITVTGRPLDDASWKGNVLDYVGWKWCEWTGARYIAANPDSAAEFIRSFATIEHIPEQMRRQDLWRLEYRRKPYMRSWSREQIRARWDELIMRSLFSFLKDAPFRLPRDETAKDMERFTHLMEEIAVRGLAIPEFKAEETRMVAAATRLQLPPAGVAWVAAQFRKSPRVT